MNDQKTSTRGFKALGGLAVIAAVGTAIYYESGDLQYMKPRSLSTITITPSQLQSNTTKPVGASIQQSFVEPIGCNLPIPTPSNTAIDESETSDSTCVRFFPERFFDSIAAPFQQQYEHSKGVKTEHPVIHMTFQNQSTTPASATTDTFPTSLTYFHIRKCGGTTMFRSLSTKSIQIPYDVNKCNRMMIDKMGIVRDVYNQQKQGRRDQPVVFSFVRDPVIRFLSSVGQMLHMGKVKLFPHCVDQRDILQEVGINQPNATIAKSQALVRCMLKSMTYANDSNNSLAPEFEYIDQHLLPQAFELRARSLEYDVGIHLMGIQHIAPTLRTLVGADRQNRHARSSRVADYTQGYFLETTILTAEMIRDICHMYAVDVLLLKRTGVATTLCDGATSLST